MLCCVACFVLCCLVLCVVLCVVLYARGMYRVKLSSRECTHFFLEEYTMLVRGSIFLRFSETQGALFLAYS